MYSGQSPDAAIDPPIDICAFDDGFEFDAYLDRIPLVAAPESRRVGPASSRPVRLSASDRQTRPPRPRIDLILYTSAESERSQRAVRAVREVLSGYDATQIQFATCDLSVSPVDGDTHGVVFTPTLVKQGPGPKTSIIGNLENADVLRDLLDASGVDRRWDD
jgi:MarR-like DNA-binding transcriptional regulator SgrR of sgrS sRNA